MSINRAAIQERADAASQPPWRLANPRPDGRNMVERHGYDLYGGEVSEMIIVDTNPADAEFIANARTDVPALLAYARDLEARNQRVLDLHVPEPCDPGCCDGDLCSECLSDYPCPTIAALTATEASA